MWTRTHELLASLVEVVSVSAAERALRKPIQIPRPQRKQTAEERREERAAAAVPIAEAVQTFTAQGRVRKAPPRAVHAAPTPVGVGA